MREGRSKGINMRFKDQVAVVTGGSRGIGKAICLALAGEGASVAFCGTNEAALRQTAGEIERKGGKALAVTADVSKAEDVQRLCDETLKAFGKVDVLVNNSGITRDGLLIRMSEKDWDDVLNVNLKGTFLATKSFTKPMMKARKGRIVNITSIIGVRGNAGQANYAASKAGIIGLTKSTARELASRNITCNAVAPGFIQTDMTKDLNEATREALLREIPLGFLGESEDIAKAVLFLASEDARYITGQTLLVDGGMVI